MEGFVGHTAPWFVLGAHGVAVLASAVIGWSWPRIGLLLCLMTTASLVGEGTGRLGLFRLWLPKKASHNLVVLPEQAANVRGTIVIAAGLDVPRVRTRRPKWARRPLAGVLSSTLLLAALLIMRALAEPLGRILIVLYAAVVLVSVLTTGFVLVTLRTRRQIDNDAGDAATLLELQRRLLKNPIPNMATWLVWTGCSHAHQDGIRAFLSLRGPRMTEPILVCTLHDVARSPTRCALSEGPLWAQDHRPTGPALVERIRWTGVRLPLVDHPDVTDARAATLMGYRALSLVGGKGEVDPASLRRAADLAERLLRTFGDDVARIESAPEHDPSEVGLPPVEATQAQLPDA